MSDPTATPEVSITSPSSISRTRRSKLTVQNPGNVNGSPFTLNNVTWTPLSTGATGFYVSAVDPDGLEPSILQVRIEGNNPGNGPAFTKTDGTASVLWVGAPIIWSGNNGNDNWTDPLNWIGGVAPTASDNAQIPAGTPFSPRVTGTQSIHDLTILSGATLAINDATLHVTGSFTNSGTITDPGGGNMDLDGVSQTLSGDIGQANITAGASYTLSGPASASLNSGLQGALTLNGSSSHRQRKLPHSGAGVVVMANPADHLIVTGNAIFGGGNSTGLLTSGTVSVGGSFSQSGSATSFNSSGTAVAFTSTGTPQAVNFANPTTSRFLDVAVASGGITLTSNVVMSTLSSTGQVSLNAHKLTADGNFTLSGAGGTLVMQSAAGQPDRGWCGELQWGQHVGLAHGGSHQAGEQFPAERCQPVELCARRDAADVHGLGQRGQRLLRQSGERRRRLAFQSAGCDRGDGRTQLHQCRVRGQRAGCISGRACPEGFRQRGQLVDREAVGDNQPAGQQPARWC